MDKLETASSVDVSCSFLSAQLLQLEPMQAGHVEWRLCTQSQNSLLLSQFEKVGVVLLQGTQTMIETMIEQLLREKSRVCHLFQASKNQTFQHLSTDSAIAVSKTYGISSDRH